MELSPSSTYRIAGRIVTFVMLTAVVFAQFASRGTVSKGPRALGLLQLAANGKGHLVPICIMVDGRFYDASIYKADPVPMALEPGTVYEGERTGESLGLFTVTGALQGNKTWLGDGKWRPAGAAPEKSPAKKAETKPREEEEGPPVLRRPGSESSRAENKPPEAKPNPPATSAPPATPPAVAPSAPPPEEDSNRPRLRRGKPTEREEGETEKESIPRPAPKTATTAPSPAAKSALQTIPAISDAGGPEPRSYSYQMKPEEEQAFRKKVLALAADEVSKRARELEPELAAPPTRQAPLHSPKGTTANRPPQTTFDDVQLRVFDVSASNEPVLVLTATAHPPATKPGSGSLFAPGYFVTLVAHSDLYGELRKLFSAVTDARHLDVTPKMELIDAVDVDGDGRGELLFREMSDVGRTYVVYRVGADQLWPLFEGTPSGTSSRISD